MDFYNVKIANLIRELLQELGENPQRPGLQATPQRVADSWSTIFSGYLTNPDEELGEGLPDKLSELVVLQDIDFYSICEHHLVPFFGKISLAYLPGKEGKIAGISRIIRMITAWAHRLQIQERLTTQIADCFMEVLHPQGLVIKIEAQHLCVSMQSDKPTLSKFTTLAARGLYAEDEAAKQTVLQVFNNR